MKKRMASMVLSVALATSLMVMPVFATEPQLETDELATETIDIEDEFEEASETSEEIEDEAEETQEDLFEEAQEDLIEGQISKAGHDNIENSEIYTENSDFVEEISETEDLSTLESEYASSEILIGDAVTEDDLAGMISTYSVTEYDTVKVTGTCNYNYAYQVLDLVNEERAAEGLSALTMDTELLDAAMQRAAESSIYCSHTRPTGESCFTLSSKMSGENLAMTSTAYGPSRTMQGWMNSEGHRANILASDFQSIGIGVFEVNGTIYWIQDFGRSSATSVTKSGTSTKTYSVEIDPNTIGPLLLSASTTDLSVGSSTTLTAKIKNTGMTDAGTPNSRETPIENSSLKWSSSDTSVATVSSSGKVTAVGNGSAKIKAQTSNGGLSDSVTITSSTGELKKVSGVWGYYKNGTLQTNYTGFAVNSSGKWYVEKGIVTKSTNGVFKDKGGVIGTSGNWYYVLNSKVQTGFTGLSNYKNSSGWWYITKGKVDRSYTGLAKNKNGWFYVKSGKVDRSYTGFASNSSGKWYVSGGKITKTKNGVLKDSKGAIGTKNTWYYVLNSKVQTSFTGLANYSNSSGWWYITKGKVDRSYNGLAKNKNGWFYLTNGKVSRSYTGLATNSNGTWYVKNGKVQKSYTGTVTINGKKYSVTNGKVK